MMVVRYPPLQTPDIIPYMAIILEMPGMWVILLTCSRKNGRKLRIAASLWLQS
jgi:hypothetical protein